MGPALLSPDDHRPGRSRDLEVAFVNNMADGARGGSDRQFVALLLAASGPATLAVHRYRGGLSAPLPGSVDEAGYAPLTALFEHRPDAVVVTGCEPSTERLVDEVFWPELLHLLDWIADRKVPAFLSCLSAHAALLAYEGIERRRLPAKCTGVFRQCIDQTQRLGHDLGDPLVMPHSRCNDVPLSEVTRAGYAPIVYSEASGWTVVSKERSGSMLVLAQGHPEYEGATLLREYRRDVRRFLGGSRSDPPSLPVDCVAPSDAEALQRFHKRLLTGEHSSGASHLSFEAVAARAPCAWAATSAGLFANWLESIGQRVATL
ncbi:MAG: homoserine O-succinyltransferase [Acidimicrobiales bacterium]|nr:homoserine O-succinyltransferase [Acidimicrobiales bacterium]